MTECQFYQEMISRLTDGELSCDEHSALIAHVKNCDECAAVYSVYSQISYFIQDEPAELPEGLHENIMANVRRAAIKNKLTPRISRSTLNLLAAAACFAVVLFAASGVATKLTDRSPVVMADEASEEFTSYDAAPAVATVVPNATQSPAPDAATASPSAAVADQVTVTPTPAPKASPVVVTPSPTPDAVQPDPYAGHPSERASNAAQSNTVVTETPTPVAPATVTQPTGNSAPSVTVSPAPVVEEQPSSAAKAVESEEDPPVMMMSEAPSMVVSVPEGEAADNATAPVTTDGIDDGIIDTEAAEQPSTKAKFSMAIRSVFGLVPPAETASPESEASPEPTAVTVDMTCREVWHELKTLLNGTASVLPEHDADKVFTLELKHGEKSHTVMAYVYGQELYYVVPDDFDGGGVFLSSCSVEDFETFIADYPQSETAAEPKATEKPAEAAVTPVATAAPVEAATTPIP